MAAMAEAIVEGAILRPLQIPRGFAQERMQYVLLGLYEWPPLFTLFGLPQRPPRYSDKEVVVSRCYQSIGNTEVFGYQLGADVHNQQRQGGVPERAAAASAGERRHQHLPRVRPQPPRLLQILLSRLQDCGDFCEEEQEAVGGEEDKCLRLPLRGGL